MAVQFRVEKKKNGEISLVLDDADGSGDLNRILGKLAKKHIEEGTTNQPGNEAFAEILNAVAKDEGVTLDVQNNVLGHTL